MPSPPQESVLVLVPAWNEAPTIGGVVTALVACGLDVLVVDDGSSDDTARLARDAGAHVVSLPLNLGVGGALRCGFRWALAHGYRAVVQCDADGQHRPEEVGALIRAARELHVDLLVGSRFLDGPPSMRVASHARVAMKVLARAASRATRSPITDATSGFRVIRGPLLGAFAASFPSHYLGDTFEAIVAAGRAGYRVAEVPTVMDDRVHGASSASFTAATRFTLRAFVLAVTHLHFTVAPAPMAPGRIGSSG